MATFVYYNGDTNTRQSFVYVSLITKFQKLRTMLLNKIPLTVKKGVTYLQKADPEVLALSFL